MTSVPSLEEDKKAYIHWAKQHPALPFGYHPCWLDAVCGPHAWSAVVAGSYQEPRGVWPFWYRRRGPFWEINQPPLTPHLGPWLHRPPTTRNTRLYAEDTRVLLQLLERLPACHYLQQNCPYHLHNMLPFHWAGWVQRPRYSYVLTLQDMDAASILAAFSQGKRQEVRRGHRQGLQFVEHLSIDAFYAFHHSCLQAAGKKPLFTLEQIRRWHAALEPLGWNWLVGALNPEGQLMAAHWIVWQSHTAYNLMMALAPAGKRCGASAWLMYQILSAVQSQTQQFDFEGSMDPRIEASYRQYGGRRHLFFFIQHNRHWLYRIRHAWRILRKHDVLG